ncbi:MAG: NADPH-dependent FMN reductase [Osedax symbiont Rs1]|nr:MAG: NADPH-dependent FMN reductase [Osedax symbiont Rs1]
MKILSFAASNNENSINQILANYVANLHPNAVVETLAIDDYELPIFSEKRENQLGQPALAQQFFAKIGQADALVVSFAEHNGSYSAAYKNLFDWTSRISQQLFQNKPSIYLSTSPGAGGAASVLSAATNSAPHFGADLKASISLPSFYQNFDTENNQLLNLEIKEQLIQAVAKLGH